MFNLLLVCGGPSLERGISLNSVRSFYDNVGSSKEVDIKVIFIDINLDKYFVDKTFLYSNTTSDFDFKLTTESKKLTDNEFLSALKEADLVVPVIHGVYGEDGTIQKIFEENNIPFVASGSEACEKMYNKANAENLILQKYGFKSIPKLILNEHENELESKINEFYSVNKLTKTVIKPIKGGSSFGVVCAGDAEDCLSKCRLQLETYGEILIEAFCEGREFTVLILQNPEGKPVALIPTEIEVKGQSEVLSRDVVQENHKKASDENSFFTTRRKYLPTNETHYYNPPRFSRELIQKIRGESEQLFKLIGAKDFVRIDGWILKDGDVYFSDFNPISGMEQNSFLFQQGAKVGFTHKSILNYILSSSAKRQGLKLPDDLSKEKSQKKRVNILLGGITSERQISLMSGSNVWLKLLNSNLYEPHPYLLTAQDNEFKVLPLSYDIILNHTVEEIIYQDKTRKELKNEKSLVQIVREELGLDLNSTPDYVTLAEFIKDSKNQDAYVFLGLHGGFGENGSIQKILEDNELLFNGSGSAASKLCMDKYKTGEVVDSLQLPNFRTARKLTFSVRELIETIQREDVKVYWQNLVNTLKCDRIVVKPRQDGCSTGVVILTDEQELKKYLDFFINKIDTAPEGTFKMHSGPVTLGVHNTHLIFEEYIGVDKISISNGKLVYSKPVGWVELTIGVLEKKGVYHALNPSITIADSGVLSLEEKFQGGTGVNITPPPEYIINSELVENLKRDTEKLCERIGIKDYCRIDVFVNSTTGEIIIIEINTLPALTPSTVLFQQVGKETPAMSPLEFLEKIISR